MLAHVVGEHWHAFHRDVIALGRDVNDLTLAQMVSIVIAAPPTSSVRYFLDQGWSRTDHLLANMAEQNAGVARLAQEYPRPGLEQRPADPMTDEGFFPAEAKSWEEFDELEKRRYANAAKGIKGRCRTRVY
jgi:membrane peptidoglycan carboxypeptidase